MKLVNTLILFFAGYSSFSQSLDTTWVKNMGLSTGYGIVSSTMLSGDSLLVHRNNAYYIKNMQSEVIDTGHFNFGMSINQMSYHNNHIYLAGTKDKRTAIAKLDRNLDTVWTVKLFTTNFSRGAYGILHDGDDIYVSGNDQSSRPFIAKLKQDGSIIWKNTFTQTTFANLSSIIKLKDGNFLASGNLDDYPLLFKFKSNGDTLWKYYEPLFISIGSTNTYEKSNGNLVFIASNKYIELDNLGKRNLPMKTLGFYANDALVIEDSVYIAGYKYTGSTKRNDAIVEVRNKDMDSLGSYMLTKSTLVNSSSWFHTIEPIGNDGFICAGLHQNASEKQNSTHNVFAALFNHVAITTISKMNYSHANVYPNPAKDFITIKTEEQLDWVQVYSYTGKLVLEQKKSRTIQTNKLSNGIYFLKAFDGEMYYNSKFVVKH